MDDPLTGLLDRSTFISLLAEEVSQANQQDKRLALLIIDVDGLARINSAFGFSVGDRALRHVASIVRQVARPQDHVSRVGNDEFALLLSNVKNRGHAELAIHKVNRLLEAPCSMGERHVNIAVRIGVGICPDHASDPELLFKVTENALQAARLQGRSYVVPEADDIESISEQWQLELELEEAVRSGQFVLHYQPQIRLETGIIVGAEALLRWDNPRRGLLRPGSFLQLAQEAGHIGPITHWAVNTALRQAGEWMRLSAPMSVSVNVPPTLVVEPDFLDALESSLQLWHHPGLTLVIEITEASIANDPKAAFRALNRILDMGADISIDDFGTGYSSLSYFKNIPATELKIDKSFVFGLLDDPSDRDIVHLIVDLARRFKLQVVAEGVENSASAELLKDIGCDIGQGFFFAEPMPHQLLTEWLQRYREKSR